MESINKGVIRSIEFEQIETKTVTKVTLNLDCKLDKDTNIVFLDNNIYELVNVSNAFELKLNDISICLLKNTKCYFEIKKEQDNFTITKIGTIVYE